MDTWIAFARGPLFRVALTICLLGLAYRVGNALWQIRRSHRDGQQEEEVRFLEHVSSLPFCDPLLRLNYSLP